MLKHIAKDLGLTKSMILPAVIATATGWLFLVLFITAVTA